MRVVSAAEVYLLSTLESLRGSWANVGNGVIACKSMTVTFVDTTLVPVLAGTAQPLFSAKTNGT